jgi:3-oxoadipate enol-lactonase
MHDQFVEREGVSLYVRVDGVTEADAPTIVFANSLGTDTSLWDPVVPLLPTELRIVRYDKRGHGRSSVPAAPYSMGALIADAEAVCDALSVRDSVFVGLSVGGMIAQGLAVKRLDLMRAVVLSNTGAKIGTKQMWDDRIATVLSKGLEPLADAVMPRWFGRDFLNTPAMEPWKALFLSTPPQGYAGVCAAIAGTDFFATTATLRLPALGIAGSEDGATPADLVRETIDLIPGSRFALIPRAGHLPCVEAPEAYARHLINFLQEIGHV